MRRRKKSRNSTVYPSIQRSNGDVDIKHAEDRAIENEAIGRRTK